MPATARIALSVQPFRPGQVAVAGSPSAAEFLRNGGTGWTWEGGEKNGKGALVDVKPAVAGLTELKLLCSIDGPLFCSLLFFFQPFG